MNVLALSHKVYIRCVCVSSYLHFYGATLDYSWDQEYINDTGL